MNLLTLNQAKMLKGRSRGYLQAILNLQPVMRYKSVNTCPNAGACAAGCLQFAGHNVFDSAYNARVRRTKLLIDSPEEFKTLLIADLYSLRRIAERKGLIPTCRLNGLSDLPWEDLIPEVFAMFQDIQFIDYTKIDERLLKRLPENYSLTYSWNEKANPEVVKQFITRGGRVAVVFDLKKGEALPERYTLHGLPDLPVVDGDISDLRHLDPEGCIVGLRWKLPIDGNGAKSKANAIKRKFLQVLN